VSRTLPIPGLAEHAIGFKSLPEAIALRNHVIRTLEAAETLDDPDERRRWLSYVFVGGGYAGVEGLAELQDFAADAIERYPRCRTQGMRWDPRRRGRPHHARDAARPRRVHRARAARARHRDHDQHDRSRRSPAAGCACPTGEQIPTHTMVWTAGVRPHPVVAELGLPLDKGRIKGRLYLQVDGRRDVWAVGDAAAVPDAAKDYKASTPPTAQHAIRQGRLVAPQRRRGDQRRQRKKPFTYKTKGVVVDLGRRKAVADTMGISGAARRPGSSPGPTTSR
jgi:NADH dehydrogenase